MWCGFAGPCIDIQYIFSCMAKPTQPKNSHVISSWGMVHYVPKRSTKNQISSGTLFFVASWNIRSNTQMPNIWSMRSMVKTFQAQNWISARALSAFEEALMIVSETMSLRNFVFKKKLKACQQFMCIACSKRKDLKPKSLRGRQAAMVYLLAETRQPKHILMKFLPRSEIKTGHKFPRFPIISQKLSFWDILNLYQYTDWDASFQSGCRFQRTVLCQYKIQSKYKMKASVDSK